MPFIRVALTTDAQALADVAVARLVAKWADWSPEDADMEVIQIETLAPMAQAAAEAASIVPDAIFRGFGTNLIGLEYLPGQNAVGFALFTAIDTAGYDAGGTVELSIGGIAFMTDDPVVIPPGDTTAGYSIVASVPGVDGNDLGGAADATTALPWLESILVDPPTTGGTEPEDDPVYQDRLSDRLQLQSTTLVTGRDFELMAIEHPAIGRAVALVGTARVVTVAVTDDAGEIVPTSVKDELVEVYEGYRQVNTTYTIIDPTYTTINVTFTLVALPGYDLADVTARAIVAVQNWLSPANWGKPPQTAPSSLWLNETVVRYSELARVLAVPGVRYVNTATLQGGTVNVNLSGTVPLTRAGTVTGSTT